MPKPPRVKDVFRNEGKIIPEGPDLKNTVVIDPKIAAAIQAAITQWLQHLPHDDVFPDPQSKFDEIGQDEPTEPNFLPKTIETMPQIAGHMTPIWKKIGQLPGYAQSGIRKIGRSVFMSFPCFQAFAQACSVRSVDPLAAVYVASDLTHSQSAVSHLAHLISQKGHMVQSGEMDHTGMIEGYKPRIIVFMTEDHTFKLVQDRPELGAPISLNSIYAWPGGLKAYREMALEAAEPQLTGDRLALE